MADKKISELPVATSLGPTDLFAIVQGGTTKRVTASLVAVAGPAGPAGPAGATGATGPAGPPGSGSGGLSGNRYIVAAADATTTIKAGAHYVCDGTDDQVQINAAAALGSVELTDGSFHVTGPCWFDRPGHSLVGAGMGEDMGVEAPSSGPLYFGTRIIVDSTFTGLAAVYFNQSTKVRPAGHIYASQFQIFGGLFGSAVDGMLIRTYQAVVDTIAISKMSGHNFNFTGFTTAEVGGSGWAEYDTRSHSLLGISSNGSGLYLGPGTADMHFANCVFANNAEAGINRDGGASNQYTNMHCYGNTLYGIWFNGAGTRDKFSNCKIEHSYRHGIYFDGTTAGTAGVQISNCGFNCNGRGTHNTYDHIGASGSQQHTQVLFTSLIFGNSDGVANLARYAINLSTTIVQCTITGCMFTTALSGAGVATGMVNASSTARTSLVMSGNYGVKDKQPEIYVPTIVANTAAGTGATVTVTGSDKRGSISLTTGTGPTAGTMCSLTYFLAHTFSGQTVIVTGADAVSDALFPYTSVAGDLNTGFTLLTRGIPAASTAYVFKYAVVS